MSTWACHRHWPWATLNIGEGGCMLRSQSAISCKESMPGTRNLAPLLAYLDWDESVAQARNHYRGEFGNDNPRCFRKAHSGVWNACFNGLDSVPPGAVHVSYQTRGARTRNSAQLGLILPSQGQRRAQ